MTSPLILGIDFTCAIFGGSSRRKPITCAEARFVSEDVLEIETVKSIMSPEEYDELLERPGPWIGGFDHPFGQPIVLLDAFELPHRWAEYVAAVGDWGRSCFKTRVEAWQSKRQDRKRMEFRACDRKAKAQAPHKTNFIPVGLMFAEGAPRLLKAKVSVPPLHTDDVTRVALEAYPALIARRFAGSYKADVKAKQRSEHKVARTAILNGLTSSMFVRDFGFCVRLATQLRDDATIDATGDKLDAILCAAQAGWAQRLGPDFDTPYGIPIARCPTIMTEGWIVDPSLLGAANLSPP